jgi:nucleoside-diphosphate-sugar epimerase
MRSRILVTGAAGFIGQSLVAHLRRGGRDVLPVTRHELARQTGAASGRDIAEFDAWPELLSDVEAVVHLAARAHVVADKAADPLEEFRRVNVAGTERLADAAVRSGVRRFVFLSSIGVLGNDSGAQAFTAADPAQPREPYAVSKWEAEQRLLERLAGTATEAVIVRPPLVYGPGVKGNFLRLLGLVHSGLPLPFAGLETRRSFVGAQNLCGLLEACIDHPAAAGRVLLAADGEDVTLPELLAAIARGLGRSARLFKVPWPLVESLASLAGRRDDLARLVGSLRVDASETRRLLGWQPRMRFEPGIRSMTEWYLARSTS